MARSKAKLKAELLAQLEDQLATARAAHEAAAAAATDEEARPENDKDTRGLEQSYLARGHAQRVADLETAVATVSAMPVRTLTEVDPIGIGALVAIEEDDKTRELYLAAHGGGLVIDGEVTVVTPTSPMGRALLGRRVDDDCELPLGGKLRTLTVTSVA